MDRDFFLSGSPFFGEGGGRWGQLFAGDLAVVATPFSGLRALALGAAGSRSRLYAPGGAENEIRRCKPRLLSGGGDPGAGAQAPSALPPSSYEIAPARHLGRYNAAHAWVLQAPSQEPPHPRGPGARFRPYFPGLSRPRRGKVAKFQRSAVRIHGLEHDFGGSYKAGGSSSSASALGRTRPREDRRHGAAAAAGHRGQAGAEGRGADAPALRPSSLSARASGGRLLPGFLAGLPVTGRGRGRGAGGFWSSSACGPGVKQRLGPGPPARPLGTSPGAHPSRSLAKLLIGVDTRMRAACRALRRRLSWAGDARPSRLAPRAGRGVGARAELVASLKAAQQNCALKLRSARLSASIGLVWAEWGPPRGDASVQVYGAGGRDSGGKVSHRRAGQAERQEEPALAGGEAPAAWHPAAAQLRAPGPPPPSLLSACSSAGAEGPSLAHPGSKNPEDARRALERRARLQEPGTGRSGGERGPEAGGSARRRGRRRPADGDRGPRSRGSGQGGNAASAAALPALSPSSGARRRRRPSRLSSACASCRQRRPRRPERPPGLPFSPRPRSLPLPPSPPRSLFSDHFFLSANPASNWRLPPSGFASLDSGLSPLGRHQSLQGCAPGGARRRLRRASVVHASRKPQERNCGRAAARGLRASPGRVSPGRAGCAKAAQDRRF
ncbi:spidroin-2-like [Zalophus californianus]|uniref:Spidroin-2-like n=1 Tax=Zalophus californianus TaxID=9704 RepID=A0A6P9FIU9_ZALCA|nr:spidroin-2-like [Zalophus californianus]